MKWRRRDSLGDPAWGHSLLLTAAFLAGTLAGCFWAGRLGGSVGEDISRYLSDYMALSGEMRRPAAGVWALASAYVRLPLLAFAAGFTSVGCLLLPVAAAAFGCSLSYAVACLRWAFGAKGLLMAGGLFGLRCLVTIPCFFLLALPAWETSNALLRASLGGGLASPPIYGRAWWRRGALVCGALVLGFLADLWIGPFILETLVAP